MLGLASLPMIDEPMQDIEQDAGHSQRPAPNTPLRTGFVTKLSGRLIRRGAGPDRLQTQNEPTQEIECGATEQE